jgi:chromatin segregation and condensation protein Rec8/ScpA/Scc1 (kleisin family)
MEAAQTELAALLATVESGGTNPVELRLAEMARSLLDTAAVEPAELDASADCLRLFARLVLLKSRALLAEPGEESEDDSDLSLKPLTRDEELLLAVQAFAGREAAISFPSASRSRLVERRKEPRPASLLSAAWVALRARQESEGKKLELPTFARLEATVSRLLRGLRQRGRVSLQRLLRGATRNDAVVHFLAVLELSRRYGTRVRQDEPFGDIVIEKPEVRGEADSRAG